MRKFTALCAALVAAVLVTGCDRHSPGDLAASGANPSVRRPVGPIPGPGDAAHPPANPYAGDATARMEGRRLFVRYNCSGCHGGHGGGGMGPSLRDVEWRYGGRPSDIFDSIAEGRAHGMPAWGPLLPEQQIWKLAAYIASMRTPDEPEPPG